MEDNMIEFGLRNSEEGFENLRITDSKKDTYQTDFGDEYDYIYNEFSLISSSKESINELFNSFHLWLDGLSKFGLDNDKILNKFKLGLKDN
jgi:hypothetical protein